MSVGLGPCLRGTMPLQEGVFVAAEGDFLVVKHVGVVRLGGAS